MSVLLAASLFDGILMVADSRVTVRGYGRPEYRVDNVQKIVPLAPYALLGFVGDVVAAGVLYQRLFRMVNEAPEKKRFRLGHPAYMAEWIPRFFQREYPYVSRAGQVTFVLGTVDHGAPNVVERSRVAALMNRFYFGTLSAQRSWGPWIIPKLLSENPPEQSHIPIGTPAAVLSVMKSPDFTPQFYAPLEHVTVGSGDKIASEVERESDMVFAGEVGNSFMEGAALRKCAEYYLHANDLKSVGGLLPACKVSSRGLEHLGYEDETPVGGPVIRLSAADGRWVQENLATGHRLGLLPPWEVDAALPDSEHTFDDHREVMRAWRARRSE